MKLTMSLRDVRDQASRCLRDARCTYGSWPQNDPLCPIYWHDPSFTFSGGGYLFFLLALLENRIDFSPSTADYVFSCASCLACDSNCNIIRCHPPYADISDIIRLLRSEMIKRGFVPGRSLQKIYDEIKKRGDYGKAIAFNLPDQIKNDQADTILFTECIHNQNQKIIYEALFRLFEKVGTPISAFAEKECCGSSLYDFGFWKEVKPLVESNWLKMKSLESKKFIFINPHCQEFIQKRYPEILSNYTGINGQHVSQFLLDALKIGKLKSRKTDKVKVSYHDPCYLGRGLKIYDFPREVLTFLEGVELIEMKRNRENSFCCGYRILGNYVPNLAKDTAKERLREFKATGAELLITACAYCKEAFQKAMPNRDRQKVKDLVEFVEERV